MPAIATAGYTVASINNAFDKNLHGLVAFLDSPVSVIHAHTESNFPDQKSFDSSHDIVSNSLFGFVDDSS